ncbi:MAG: hypothetical protein EBS53_09970 [Bacteroidetes bacterium]|nr:hypothetical protein [Bacteroidota bacterium]
MDIHFARWAFADTLNSARRDFGHFRVRDFITGIKRADGTFKRLTRKESLFAIVANFTFFINIRRISVF